MLRRNMCWSAQKLQVVCILSLIFYGQAAFVTRKNNEFHGRPASWSRPVMHRQTHLLSSSPESNNMHWLSNPMPDSSKTQLAKSSQDEEPPDDLGNVIIPSTGISVKDELDEAQKDKFVSEVVPITGLPGVAQIVTTASGGGIEPVRYLASLSPPKRLGPAIDDTTVEAQETPSLRNSFVMVDVPPFSDKLLAQIHKFMGGGASLKAMLITSRNAIHYDETPAVFATRKSDLEQWAAAFPGIEIIGYRLDIPRDCRDMITQRLDGYGPWALDERGTNITFVETGRPLTYEEWDKDVAKNVMDQGITPPDDELDEADNDLYTPEAIRNREEDKRLLAIYTPGHTFGSVTYIFPEIQACCSGYTIPVEDDRYDDTMGIGGGGPSLDFRGYITTSQAGMSRMMESARHVVDMYSDRFTVVLPSRGDPLFVDSCGSAQDRKDALNDIIDQYDKIGKIYEQLGITSADDERGL
jgi:hypothetical protein